MKVLAIRTSAREVIAALVRDNRDRLRNVGMLKLACPVCNARTTSATMALGTDCDTRKVCILTCGVFEATPHAVVTRRL